MKTYEIEFQRTQPSIPIGSPPSKETTITAESSVEARMLFAKHMIPQFGSGNVFYLPWGHELPYELPHPSMSRIYIRAIREVNS